MMYCSAGAAGSTLVVKSHRYSIPSGADAGLKRAALWRRDEGDSAASAEIDLHSLSSRCAGRARFQYLMILSPCDEDIAALCPCFPCSIC